MFTNRNRIQPITACAACWAMTTVFVVVIGWITCLPIFAQGLINERLPKTWQHESALRDVHFVDVLHGWAVGDQGVILKTVDGGQNWTTVGDVNRSVQDWNHAAGSMSLKEKLQGVRGRQVQSAVSTSTSSAPKISCQLNSVFFLNRNDGWAAGGYAVPRIDRTRSVILRTNDGGNTWRVIPNTMPPHIKQIHFSDQQSGWAIGQSGNTFTSGIFFTHDGGQSWQPQPTNDRRGHDWIRADRRGEKLIGVSPSGRIKTSEQSAIENGGVLSSAKQHFRDIVIDGDGSDWTGWAVGTGGAIFETRNQGLSWQAPKALTVDEKTNSNWPLDLIDFRSAVATDSKIWAAGKPGGCIVSISKQSGAVKFHATPITTAINRITFVDELHGWAVGDLGIVIATDDGGENWQVQRRTQMRIGMLGVCFSQQELPLELLAQYACEDDVLCGVTVFETIETHFFQSASRCGSAIVDRINLPDVKDAALQQAAVIRKLVVEIRTHRPDCLVLNPSIHQSIADSLDREKLLQLAVHTAADATYESERFEAIGLKPWQVQRLAIADVTGHLVVSGEKFLPNLAATIGERIFTSRSLIELGSSNRKSRPSQRTQKITYRVVRFLGRGAGGQSTTAVPIETDPLVGLHSLPRRKKTQHPPGDLTMLGRRNRKRESLKRILDADVNDAQSMFAWQNEMLSLMLTSDRMTSGNGVMELASECFDADKPELSAKALDFLVQRFPEHAQAPAALLWLSAYYASDEYSQRAFVKTIDANQTNMDSKVALATHVGHADMQSASGAGVQTSGDGSVSTLQVNRLGSGDRELTWSVPDKDLLTRQIKDARNQRLTGGIRPYTEEERKLFQLGDALSGKTGKSEKQNSSAEAQQSATTSAEVASVSNDQKSRVIQASATDSISAPILSWDQFVLSRRQMAAKYLSKLRGQDPDLSLSQQTLAIELTLLKHSPQSEEAIDRMQQLLKSAPRLRQTILRETALLRKETTIGRTNPQSVRCPVAIHRPKLDGEFDDEVWQKSLAAKTYRQMENSDVVFFARDEQFLYLIARMKKQPNYDYRFDRKRRVRDANLVNRDRIQISFDTDRDDRTAFELTIDHRGWVNETFDAISDWDPQWFVSQSEDKESWTVEAAIPRSAFQFQHDLDVDQANDIANRPDDSAPWTIGLRRRVFKADLWSEASENSQAQAHSQRSMLDLLKPNHQRQLFIFE